MKKYSRIFPTGIPQGEKKSIKRGHSSLKEISYLFLASYYMSIDYDNTAVEPLATTAYVHPKQKYYSAYKTVDYCLGQKLNHPYTTVKETMAKSQTLESDQIRSHSVPHPLLKT